MIQRFWHRLFGHKWTEMAVRVPASAETGQRVDITTLLRRCPCGAAQSAQVIGNVLEVARLDCTNSQDAEIQALRKMAGIPNE